MTKKKAKAIKTGNDPLKRCPDCDYFRPIEDFGPSADRYDGLQPYCREHKNARAGNKKHSELSDEQKYRANVRSKLKMRVRRGLIIKATNCTWCGDSENIEAHHEDYDKPYDVIWLCRKCHDEHHSK